MAATIEHIIDYVKNNTNTFSAFETVKVLSFLLTQNNHNHFIVSGYVKLQDGFFAEYLDIVQNHYWIELNGRKILDLSLKYSFQDSEIEYHWDITSLPHGIFEPDYPTLYFGQRIKINITKEEYQSLISHNDDDDGWS